MVWSHPSTAPSLLRPPASRRAFLRSGLTVGALGMPAGCGVASAASSRAATTAGGDTVVRYQGWPNTVLNVEPAADLGHLVGVQLQWAGSTAAARRTSSP